MFVTHTLRIQRLHHLIELSSKTSYACALVLVVALFWSRTRRLFLHFVAPPVQKKGASSNNGISANGFSRSVSNFVWWHVDESITSVPIIWVGGMFLWASVQSYIPKCAREDTGGGAREDTGGGAPHSPFLHRASVSSRCRSPLLLSVSADARGLLLT